MPPAAKGGGGSGAVRAGRAFVELFAQDNKLYRALDAAQARLKSWGAQSAKIGLAAGAGASAILAPLAKTFTDAAGRGAKIDQLAKRFGTTTESVSSLAYAFETSGVTLEEFEGTIDGLRSKIVSAADANEDVIQGLASFRTLGRQLIAMPLEKQIDHLADAFTRITLATDQAEQAQSLFGASGLKVLEVIKRGSAALAERKAAAGPGGGLVSQADATRSTQLMKAYTDVWQGLKYTLLEVGAALLPVGDGAGSFSNQVKSILVGVRAWINQNRDLIQTVAKVAAGVAAGGIALVAFGAILGTIASAIGAVVTIMSAAFMPQVLIATAAITALSHLFKDDLSAGFKSFAADATEAWDGIVQAMGRGDLGAAAGLGLALVTSEWAKATLYWTTIWNKFKDTFLDGWRDIVTMIAGGWAVIGEGLDILPEGTAQNVVGDRNRQREEDRKAREADIRAAEAEVKAAKDRLDAANAAAREGKPGGGGNGWVQGIAAAAVRAVGGAAGQLQQKPRLPSPGELFNAVKGTFSTPYAAQQLGYGDNAQKRQLDALQGIDKKAAAMPEIKKGIDDLNKNLAFK